MFEFYEPLAQSKGVAIALDAPAPTPVLGDADLLREAVSNLVDNAIKFTPEGGGVRVAAEVVGGRATVAVSDSGPGVAPQDREKVFRRFYRSEPSGPASGSGLGLSIAKSIAKLHGFSLKVEDNAPGARFVLRDESRAVGGGGRAAAIAPSRGAPRRRSEADAATSGSARRGELGAGRGAQQVEVGRHRAQGEASLRRGLGAPPVHAEQAGELAMGGDARGDLIQRAVDLRVVRIDDIAAMERDRQIAGADEHPVDAGRRQDRVERGQRFARFDHGDRQRQRIGAVKVGGADEAAQRQGRARSPGAGAAEET